MFALLVASSILELICRDDSHTVMFVGKVVGRVGRRQWPVPWTGGREVEQLASYSRLGTWVNMLVNVI